MHIMFFIILSLDYAICIEEVLYVAKEEYGKNVTPCVGLSLCLDAVLVVVY